MIFALLALTPIVWAPAPMARADEAKAAYGRELFNVGTAPACAVCHTLAAAGSAGRIGPNLDTLAPGRDRIRNAIVGGVGVMPPYGEALSSDDVDAIVAFVSGAVSP